MLRTIAVNYDQPSIPIFNDSHIRRDEKADMKRAIELLYEFKESLNQLHPNCVTVIDHLLQHPKY